MSELIRDRFIW